MDILEPINTQKTVDKIKDQIRADVLDHTAAMFDCVCLCKMLRRYYHHAGNSRNAERNRILRSMRKFMRFQKNQIAIAAQDLQNIELAYDAYKYICANSAKLSSACATFEKFINKFADVATECEISIMENTADLNTEIQMRELGGTANTGRVSIRLDSAAQNARIMFLRHNIAQNTTERNQAQYDQTAIQILYNVFKTRIHTLNNRTK